MNLFLRIIVNSDVFARGFGHFIRAQGADVVNL